MHKTIHLLHDKGNLVLFPRPWDPLTIPYMALLRKYQSGKVLELQKDKTSKVPVQKQYSCQEWDLILQTQYNPKSKVLYSTLSQKDKSMDH